jgi:hypothetical protein
VEPLYSLIPAGITGHNTAFFDAFPERSPAKARELLRRAGVQNTAVPRCRPHLPRLPPDRRPGEGGLRAQGPAGGGRPLPGQAGGP